MSVRSERSLIKPVEVCRNKPAQTDASSLAGGQTYRSPHIRRLSGIGVSLSLLITGNTAAGSLEAAKMIASSTPGAISTFGNSVVGAGSVAVDASRSVRNFFVSEAGASELSPSNCPHGTVGSFTQSTLDAGGYTEPQAVSYYDEQGYDVVKVNGGWQITCRGQSAPVEPTPTQPPTTTPPPPPATTAPDAVNQSARRATAVQSSQTKSTVVATIPPTTATPSTTTTAPLPRIIINGEIGSAAGEKAAKSASVEDFFDGGTTESSGQPSDPTRKDQPTPVPEGPEPKPANDQPVDVAVLPIAGSKDEMQTRQLLSSGKTDTTVEPKYPQLEQTSKLEAERARSELSQRLQLLQTAVANGSMSVDQLTEQVMPPGMKNQAWCLGIITKQLTDMGFSVNRPGTKVQETGVLNFYRLLQTGPITSQDGQKTLSLIGAEDAIDKPLLEGDILLFKRQGEGSGHASTVTEDYDPMYGGFAQGIDGNWGKGLAITSRKLTPDMGGQGTLTEFLGVARMSGVGASTDPLQKTPLTDNDGQEIVVTVRQNTPSDASEQKTVPVSDGRSFVERAVAHAPDSIIKAYETATGASLSPPPQIAPPKKDPAETQVTVRVSSDGEISVPPTGAGATPTKASTENKPLEGSVVEGSSGQTENSGRIGDLPPDARDMTEEQAQAMFKKLEGLQFKRTTSIEEYVTYYYDFFYVESYLSGAPIDVIAAHSSIEAGQSADGGERQNNGWPSGSFETDLNSHGIKVSATKGCRISQTGATSSAWDTNEGTAGVDQHVEKGAKFCKYDNFLLAAQSFAALLKEVYGVSRENPVDAEGYIAHLQGKWMTERDWPVTIRQRLEKIIPYMNKN